MALPLATDIRITHGDDTVRLIPSLRAAYLLNRAYGIDRLKQAARTFDVSITFDILAHSGNGIEALQLFRRKADATSYLATFEDIASPLDEFLGACFVVDPDPAVEPPAETRAKAGEPFDIGRYLTDLFEFATGWLGWTPSEAWAAIPAEIVAAQRGLLAKLEAVHGSGDPDSGSSTYDPREEISEDQMREGIAALKAQAERCTR